MNCCQEYFTLRVPIDWKSYMKTIHSYWKLIQITIQLYVIGYYTIKGDSEDKVPSLFTALIYFQNLLTLILNLASFMSGLVLKKRVKKIIIIDSLQTIFGTLSLIVGAILLEHYYNPSAPNSDFFEITKMMFTGELAKAEALTILPKRIMLLQVIAVLLAVCEIRGRLRSESSQPIVNSRVQMSNLHYDTDIESDDTDNSFVEYDSLEMRQLGQDVTDGKLNVPNEPEGSSSQATSSSIKPCVTSSSLSSKQFHSPYTLEFAHELILITDPLRPSQPPASYSSNPLLISSVKPCSTSSSSSQATSSIKPCSTSSSSSQATFSAIKPCSTSSTSSKQFHKDGSLQFAQELIQIKDLLCPSQSSVSYHSNPLISSPQALLSSHSVTRSPKPTSNYPLSRSPASLNLHFKSQSQ